VIRDSLINTLVCIIAPATLKLGRQNPKLKGDDKNSYRNITKLTQQNASRNNKQDATFYYNLLFKCFLAFIPLMWRIWRAPNSIPIY
jgi:hypothetical protein